MTSKRIGETGRKAEDKLAKRLGAGKTKASGAANGDKGDMRVENWLIESKSTTGPRYALALNDLAKIQREAQVSGKRAALAIQFIDLAGTPLKYGSWVAIPEHLFKTLMALKEE